MSAPSGRSADIAIIGMACRLPGAENHWAFWDNLCRGVESIAFFSDGELLAAGADPALLRDPRYVKASPVLRDIDRFDAGLFEYSPREAAVMDPQHRLFLEVAWEAFEDAGYQPGAVNGVVGVFAGAGGVITSYLKAHATHPMFAHQTASVQHIGNDKDFLATRVSYKLDLTGPSVTVQTACSTSLVAVHLAGQSLIAGECDMVLAGAATVRVPHLAGYLAEKGHVQSLDGHCRAFDANAQGTVFGSGVAAVLLKRADDARSDGDHIYALIKGTAVNNDGGQKVSYTAPSVTGQARAMVEAMTLAGVDPETIGFVECHATGTVVGDPLEIQALTRAFETRGGRRRFCAVGSVKPNIGHPEQTAGLAGLIKAALCLERQRIPPTINLHTPNPKIDFEDSPFFANTELLEWPAGGAPRRAAVNSLGIGGTNAFAVLEEASPAAEGEAAPARDELFAVSARSEGALREYARRFRDFLGAHGDSPLGDVCYTASVSRSQFLHRLAVTADTVEVLRDRLAAVAEGREAELTGTASREPRPVAFLFTGQGSQYPGMARELYRTQPAFRAALERCASLLDPSLRPGLLEVLHGAGDVAALVHQTAWTQPALFAVEYALAELWRAWGVVPGAVMGHSVGELVAACVGGVVDLPAALSLAAERGRLMQAAPGRGAMAAVLAPEELVRAAIAPYGGRVAVAAVNAPSATVISGERAPVHEVLEVLRAQGIASTPLTVSHAFHSPLMDPVLDTFRTAAGAVEFRAPRLPLLSNVTGRAMERAPDAEYWCRQLRETVRFADGMAALAKLGYTLFLEVGPGATLLGLGRQCLPGAENTWNASLGKAGQDRRTILKALGRLYLEGFPLVWPAVHDGRARRRLSLPTYPFERKRYWIEPGDGKTASDAVASASPMESDSTPSGIVAHPLLGPPRRGPSGHLEFESSWGLANMPYLADHRIHDTAVLPMAVALEAALGAGRAWLSEGDLAAEHVTYHEAMVFSGEASRPIRLALAPQGHDRAAFELQSADGRDEPWRTHLTGFIARAPAAMPGAQGTRHTRDGGKRIPGAAYYAAIRRIGLGYGRAFQGVRALHRRGKEVLARVRMPATLPRGDYLLHPAFLDACLHVYPAVVGDLAGGERRRPGAPPPYLPISVERLSIFRGHTVEGWTHAAVRGGGPNGDGPVLDISVYDAEMRPVAAFEGLRVRRLAPAVVTSPPTSHARWLYHVRWEERPITAIDSTAGHQQGSPDEPHEAAQWLILADRAGVGAALARAIEHKGERCRLVFAAPAGPGRRGVSPARRGRDRGRRAAATLDPSRPSDFRSLIENVMSDPSPCRGVVYLWPLDLPSLANAAVSALEKAEALAAGSALFLIQALSDLRASGGASPRLWLVTSNAQAVGAASPPVEPVQGLLWGLGRTLALESPSLWGGLIDLAPGAPTGADIDMLATQILTGDGEDQVALRGGRRLVARLARLGPAGAAGRARPFRSDGTYLLTGGLGVLGLQIARWLVQERGVRSLVLAGRRGAAGAARHAVRALEALGASVRVVKADVAREADVRRLLRIAARRGHPLRGVIHGAGVLDDGVLGGLTWKKFTAATAPKVKGAWLLHRHARDLDVFVVHSSVLSLIGSAGQANYTAANAFLDALMAHRRARGLSATTINWGPWAGRGMAAVSGARGAAIWKTRGMRYIEPEDGTQIFADLLDRGIGEAAVTITDWATFLNAQSASPFYSQLTGEIADGRPSRGGHELEAEAARFRDASPAERRALLLGVVRRHVTQELGFDEPIDPRLPLSALGLDSLMSVNVANRLERAVGTPVPVVKLIRGPSVEELVDDLLPRVADLVVGGTGENGHAAIPPATHGTGVSPASSRAPVETIAGGGWLIFPRPNPSARVRLFCFPFAGGGATPYRPWAAPLDPAIELVVIEPPGRASRIQEPPVPHLDAFLAALETAMMPYLDKPCAFVGYCLGGITLFELARRLRGRPGVDLGHLFVAGSRAPQLAARQGRFEEDLLANLLKQRAFDPLRPPHEQPDDVFAEFIRHFNIGATEDLLGNAELRGLLLPAIRADIAMALSYRFKPEPPLDVPITTFVGVDDPYVSRQDALGWASHTNVGFRLHLRRGAHFLIADDKEFTLETIRRELAP